MDELPGAQKVPDTECLEVFQAELDNLWHATSPKLRSNCRKITRLKTLTSIADTKSWSRPYFVPLQKCVSAAT